MLILDLERIGLSDRVSDTIFRILTFGMAEVNPTGKNNVVFLRKYKTSMVCRYTNLLLVSTNGLITQFMRTAHQMEKTN